VAELRIVYDSSRDVESFLKKLYKAKDPDNGAVSEELQGLLQIAFDEGRRFQTQLTTQSRVTLTSKIEV